MSDDAKSKRILKLNWIEGRPSLSGGIKSNRLIAEAMQRRGHIVTTSFLPPSWPWPKLRQVRGMIKRIRRGIGDKHYRHHLEGAKIGLNQMPRRELNPDLIPDADVTLASWWSVWRQVHGWSASKGLKVHYVRGYEIYNHDKAIVDMAYKLSGPRIVISSWLQDILKGMGHDEVVRVPNGVDWLQFDSKPRAKTARPTIGMLMGRSDVKDTATGMRAVRRLMKLYPDLRVIGFGAQELLEDMDVPECVEYHHHPDQSIIPQLYQQTNCWIITSTSEGFGMPGIEAMASHCPMVSTRCGGPSDFVREGINGHLVDVGDDEAMADRIAKVLDLDDDSWTRMSQASYTIAQEFDWDRSAEKLEATLYQWLDRSGQEWGK